MGVKVMDLNVNAIELLLVWINVLYFWKKNPNGQQVSS